MDLHEVISHIDDRMTEINVEDERNSNTWGPLGYGGPGWDTAQRLEAYGLLLDFFNDLSGDKKSELDIKAEVLGEFFEWFLDYEEGKYRPVQDEKIIEGPISSRFEIMEIENDIGS